MFFINHFPFVSSLLISVFKSRFIFVEHCSWKKKISGPIYPALSTNGCRSSRKMNTVKNPLILPFGSALCCASTEILTSKSKGGHSLLNLKGLENERKKLWNEKLAGCLENLLESSDESETQIKFIQP